MTEPLYSDFVATHHAPAALAADTRVGQVFRRYVAGQTHKRIAADLCIERSTVKTYLERAKEAYRADGRVADTREDCVARAHEDLLHEDPLR